MLFLQRSSLAAGAVATLVLSLLGAAAGAADKKAAASPAPAKTPLLTMAQLRECVAQKDKLGKETDAAVKAKAEVAALKAGIDSSGAALAEQANTLDRTSDEAVSPTTRRSSSATAASTSTRPRPTPTTPRPKRCCR